MAETTSRKKLFGYIIIAAAGLGMTFLGIPLVHNSGANDVATVDGTKISQEQFRQAFANAQQQFASMPREQLQQMALTQLINHSLMQNHVEKSGYQVSDAVLFDAVKQQFGDDATYKAWLQRNGMTAKAYQALLQKSLATQNYYQYLQDNTIQSDANIETLITLLSEKRDMTVVTLPIASKEATINATPEAVKAYYDAHHDAYMTPETVSVQYVLLDATKLVPEDKVTAADMDAEKAKLRSATERAGHYIIFDKESDAASAAKAIQEGSKTFADISKAVAAQTISGQAGDFDLHKEGDGVSQKADTALFALAKVGDVSPVITTSYGPMLVTLSQIQAEPLPDDATLRKLTAQALGEKAYSDISNAAYDKVENNGTLAEIAALAHGEVQTLNNITAQSKTPAWLSNEKVLPTLFGTQKIAVNQLATPVELAPNQSLFYRISAREAPKLQPFTAVADQVREDYRVAEAKAALRKDAQAISDALSKHAPIDALVAADNGKVQQIKALSRFQNTQDVPNAWLRPLFNQTDAIAIHEDIPDTVMVSKIDAITRAKDDHVPQEFIDSLKAQLASNAQLATSQSIADWLRKQAKIKVNQQLLTQ